MELLRFVFELDDDIRQMDARVSKLERLSRVLLWGLPGIAKDLLTIVEESIDAVASSWPGADR